MKYLFSNSIVGKFLIVFFIIYCYAQQSNAQTWKPMNVGTTYPLKNIYFVNDTVGYIIDEYGFVHETSDGGSNWSLASGGITAGVNFYFFSKDTGLVIGQGIFKTVNGGATWDTILPFNDYIFSLSFPGNGNIGFASAATGAFDSVIIYKTTDRGNNWNRMPAFSSSLAWPYIYFTDVNIGYLGNYDGTIYKTTNGGSSWTLQYSNPSQYEIYGLSFPANDTGFVVADAGTIIKTTDGQNWATQTSGTTDPLNSVFFTSVNNGYAVGGTDTVSGTILKTVNGGQNWTVDLHTTVNYWAVFFPSAQIGYVCGDSGVALKFNADSVSAVNELISENDFKIYPNPAGDEFTVYSSQFTEGTTLTIFNDVGEKVYQCAFNAKQKTIKGQLSSGIYFVELKDEQKQFTEKIIIQ